MTYTREFMPLINDAALTAEALAAAADAPGCFLFIGNGEASAPLHHPGYDFHDAALLHGTKLHTAIARRCLPMAGQVF